MKAKITPLNKSVPDKDVPGIESVPADAESKPDNNMTSHLTWETPNSDELRRLNLAMVWKFIRLLLLSLAVFGYMLFLIWIRNLGQSLNFEVISLLCGSLPLVFYYMWFRAPLLFGERKALDDDIRERSAWPYLFGVGNLILLAPVFLLCVDLFGFVSYILAAIMALLTYWKEYFMLILYVCRKYTVKDGYASYRKRIRNFEMTENHYRGFSWISLVYLLDFEDAAERDIPVMVDLYTYCRFKKDGHAILINYKYGDSYWFELVKTKDPSGS